MINAGVDVFRVKSSHVGVAEISDALVQARRQIDQNGGRVQLLADLPEAKIRIGDFPDLTAGKADGRIKLKKGQEYRFLKGELSADPEAYIPVAFEGLGSLLKTGDQLSVYDGRLMFEVTTVHSANEFIARLLNDGHIARWTSIVAPGIMDQIDHIVPEIDEIIRELPKSRPDMVSFSFVKNQRMMHELMDKLMRVTTPDWRPMVIAKIESEEGVKNVDEILEVCHGIMVARGDLALSMPFEQLGVIQKRLVAKARQAGKYVIVSTGALASMLDNHVPQRSDILDVTNATLDGASAIMLCPETCHSEEPERAVKAAKDIIAATKAA